MNRIQDRSILFYSTFDPISQKLLDQLSKFPLLLEQVTLIPLNATDGTINRNLPKAIKTMLKRRPDKIPIFVPAGVNNIVFGEHAISWLENCIHNKFGGITFGSFQTSIVATAATLDTKGRMTRRDLFNDTEFHMNAEEIQGIKDFTQQYASVKDSSKMKLTTDRTNKSQASRDIKAKFQAIKSDRMGLGRSTGPSAISKQRVDPRPVPQIPWGGQFRPMGQRVPGGTVPIPKPVRLLSKNKKQRKRVLYT